MKRIGLVIIVCASTVGWLVPAALGFMFLLDWCDEMERGTIERNSFPFLVESRQFLTIAAAWLGVVILAWSATLAIQLSRSTPRPPRSPR